MHPFPTVRPDSAVEGEPYFSYVQFEYVGPSVIEVCGEPFRSRSAEVECSHAFVLVRPYDRFNYLRPLGNNDFYCLIDVRNRASDLCESPHSSKSS